MSIADASIPNTHGWGTLVKEGGSEYDHEEHGGNGESIVVESNLKQQVDGR